MPASLLSLLLLTDRTTTTMNTDEITDEQVEAFFRRKLEAITKEIPGACLFRATIWNNISGFKFDAYSEHYKHFQGSSSAEAVSLLLEEARGKSIEDMRRERVEELRAELLRLEAESLPA